jgi:cell wall assembly regulator SMI1
MSTIGERLRAHWHAQGIKLPPGVSEDRLKDFETRFGVALPTDLREYFLHVDGLSEPFQWDQDLFNFYPLSEVESISDLEIMIEDKSSYFVIADHSIWLPAFAIRLAPSATGPHPVIAIETDNKGGYGSTVVANSFSEFVERYLSDEPSRNDLSLGIPVTTEQGPAMSKSRHDLLKSQVETIDSILSTLASFDDIPGLDVVRGQTEITRKRLREIKEKAIEELRSPEPHT